VYVLPHIHSGKRRCAGDYWSPLAKKKAKADEQYGILIELEAEREIPEVRVRVRRSRKMH